jgi:hypothetical protein
MFDLDTTTINLAVNRDIVHITTAPLSDLDAEQQAFLADVTLFHPAFSHVTGRATRGLLLSRLYTLAHKTGNAMIETTNKALCLYTGLNMEELRQGRLTLAKQGFIQFCKGTGRHGVKYLLALERIEEALAAIDLNELRVRDKWNNSIRRDEDDDDIV